MTLIWPRRTGFRSTESSLIKPGACAFFQVAPRKESSGGSLLGSPLEGGALFSEERTRQVLGAVHLLLVGLVRMGKTSRVQVWCAGHFHPSLKNKNKNQKTKHHHSINEISRSPPFSLPVLFVIYVSKTVWVFIMLVCFAPPSLGFKKCLLGSSLSLFFPPRACMPVFRLLGRWRW